MSLQLETGSKECLFIGIGSHSGQSLIRSISIYVAKPVEVGIVTYIGYRTSGRKSAMIYSVCSGWLIDFCSVSPRN